MSYNTLVGSQYVSGFAPAGSIVPYYGTSVSDTTDPPGWVICNGTVRNDNFDGKYNKVASLGIGTGGSGTSNYTPPNLAAAFLRGTGTAPGGIPRYIGPAVGAFQQQQMVQHGHSFPAHTHTTTPDNQFAITTFGTTFCNDPDTGGNAEPNVISGFLRIQGLLTGITYTSTVNSVASGGSGPESRPGNYGVRWILKL